MSKPLDEAKDTAQEVARKTQETVSDASKRVIAAAAVARDRASEMIDDVDLGRKRAALERRTRANPLAALLVAGLVGMVLSRVLFPKRN